MAGFLRFRDRFVIGHVLSRGIPLVINLAGGYVDGVTTERLRLDTARIAVEMHFVASGLASPWRLTPAPAGGPPTTLHTDSQPSGFRFAGVADEAALGLKSVSHVR